MAGSEGTAFGKYFLLKKIAAGGMGEIFLAKLKGPVGFEKLLVIKRILAHHVENEEFLDMFFAEARVAAQLTHSNVVQIYEMGEIEDSYFIAMEYVHGKSLRDVIDRARDLGEYVPAAHAVEMISKLCAGLSYAHNARDMAGDRLGIIHRDINPHNMLVSYSGDVKVIDFGIAKSEMSMHKTETGTIKGKFVYMSPEQSAAEELDKRSDIFAVGICLYECLTFVNPFAKANVVLSLDAIQRKEAPPPSETSPKLAPFDPIVQRALAKRADERYSDASEMHDDLLQLLRSGQVLRLPHPLSDYMHDLFEDQIEQEKRMIVETDSATTGQIQAMRAARRSDSHGSARLRLSQSQSQYDDDDDEEIAAHAATVDVIDDVSDEMRSRVPFFLALAGIGVLALGSSATIVELAQPGPAGAAVMAMAPVAGNANVAPNPTGGDAHPARPIFDVEHGDKKQDHHAAHTRGARSRRDSRRSEPKREPARTEKPARGAGTAPPNSVEPPPPPPPPPPVDNSPAKPKPKAAPPPRPPPATTFGNMSISTTPPVKITHKGRAGQTFKLKSGSGVILFGNPSEAGKFYIKISYKIGAGSIRFTNIESEPWAIVRGKRGIGLGKTPLANVNGNASTLLEFLNPKEGLRQRITLRYSPP